MSCVAREYGISLSPAGAGFGIAQFLDHQVVQGAGALEIAPFARHGFLSNLLELRAVRHPVLGGEMDGRIVLLVLVCRLLDALDGIANIEWLAAILGFQFPEQHLVAKALLVQDAMRARCLDRGQRYLLEGVAGWQRHPESGRAG